MPDRFILLAYPRTGSSLIAHALGVHPAVAMYGELFHPIEAFRKHVVTAADEAPYPLSDYYRAGADPVEYLERELYGRAFPPDKKMLGFKLFHRQHLPSPARERLFDWLAGMKGIRIIHLYRKRLLAAYVSFQRALLTHEWGIKAGDSAHGKEAPPLTIDVEGFQKYADEILSSQDLVAGLFREHPMLTIEYREDVAEHYDATIGRIEEFLNLDVMSLPQLLKKQARRPIEEEVTNLAEVQAVLRGTRYEAFL